ncbi:MAG: hypothetical protein GY758_28230, partial [Fuerstiella sp.]|nr:hypothetical protein [Fuerstiella sp.]
MTAVLCEAACSADVISVSPAAFEINGGRQQIQLVVMSGQAARIDVTRQAEYTVSAPNVVVVSDTGVVRPFGNGSVTVTVRYAGENVQT